MACGCIHSKTQPDQPRIVQHSPYCRTVYLEVGPAQATSSGYPGGVASQQLLEYLPQAVEAFQAFAAKEGMNYPLVHSCDWISGRMGLCLKELSNIQLIHSHSEQQLMTEWNLWQRADQVIVTRSLDKAVTHHRPYADAKTILGFNPTERIVLYVSSSHAQAGLETLIQAFALCRTRSDQGASRYESHSLRLVLVSDSNQQEQQFIEQQLNALQLSEQTRFVNAVSPELRSLYYAAADVCVIPSLYEPFGSVALEALIHGTPVVASNVGGLKFVVASEETGLLVPPQDVPALAEAIARVLSGELWVRRLRRQASGQIDSSLSSIQVAAQLSNLYRRLLASSISQVGLWDVQKPWVLQIAEAALSTRSVSSNKPAERELMHVS